MKTIGGIHETRKKKKLKPGGCWWYSWNEKMSAARAADENLKQKLGIIPPPVVSIYFIFHFMKPPTPSRFQLIFLSSFMKPQMVSSFMAKNIPETTKNFKINHETRSQKKMRVFLLKSSVPSVSFFSRSDLDGFKEKSRFFFCDLVSWIIVWILGGCTKMLAENLILWWFHEMQK